MLGYEMTTQECSMGYGMLDYVPPCPTGWEKATYHMHANRSPLEDASRSPLEDRRSNMIYTEGVLSSEFNTHPSLLILKWWCYTFKKYICIQYFYYAMRNLKICIK